MFLKIVPKPITSRHLLSFPKEKTFMVQNRKKNNTINIYPSEHLLPLHVNTGKIWTDMMCGTSVGKQIEI